MVVNKSPGRGDSKTLSPEALLPSSKAGWHFKSATPHSSRDKGVAGIRSNLKCQWVVGMSSGMTHSRAVSMGKRIHVPRR